MGFRFYIQMGVSGLRFRLGIKVWDSFLRFSCSCLGFGYAVLVSDSGFGYRFGIEVWGSGLDSG